MASSSLRQVGIEAPCHGERSSSLRQCLYPNDSHRPRPRKGQHAANADGRRCACHDAAVDAQPAAFRELLCLRSCFRQTRKPQEFVDPLATCISHSSSSSLSRQTFRSFSTAKGEWREANGRLGGGPAFPRFACAGVGRGVGPMPCHRKPSASATLARL